MKDYKELKWIISEGTKKSGFFDLPIEKTCRHPEHNPPSHIHIPSGKGYKHVCPACGGESIIIPKHFTL